MGSPESVSEGATPAGRRASGAGEPTARPAGPAALSARWRRAVLLGVSLECFLTAGPVFNYNVLFADLQREFGTSALATGKCRLP